MHIVEQIVNIMIRRIQSFLYFDSFKVDLNFYIFPTPSIFPTWWYVDCYTWVTWSPAGMCVLLLLCAWCWGGAIEGCDDLALLCRGWSSVGDCCKDFLITGLPLWDVMPPNDAIAPALLWSSVEPLRPWAWRGEEFLELLPLAISVLRS